MNEQIQSIKPQDFRNNLRLTTKNVAMIIVDIMYDHVGMENAISREKLFRKIYRKSDEGGFEDWLRWDFVKKAMHLLRVRTRCFISPVYINDGYSFYVINSVADAKSYIDILDNNIRKMKLMQKKALKAGAERWGSKDWQIDKLGR